MLGHTAHVEKMTNENAVFVSSLRKTKKLIFQSVLRNCTFFLLRRGLLDKIFMIFVEYDNGIDGAKYSFFFSFCPLKMRFLFFLLQYYLYTFPSLCGHLFITALFREFTQTSLQTHTHTHTKLSQTCLKTLVNLCDY